jgi:hypothetical protein
MAAGLTLAQMEFLASKGLSIDDAIVLAKLGGAKSKGAERTARWRAKKQCNVTSDVTCDASPPPIEDHTPPVSSNDETPAPPRKRKMKLVIGRPDGVAEQTWSDFVAMRDRQKADISETALSGIRSEAEKAGWTLEAALARCVMRNWRGFEAKWVAEERGTGPPGNVSYFDHLSTKLARTPA